MRRILTVALLIGWIFTDGQTSQTKSDVVTATKFLALPAYADTPTTGMKADYQIRTFNNKTWIRNHANTQWLEVGSGTTAAKPIASSGNVVDVNNNARDSVVLKLKPGNGLVVSDTISTHLRTSASQYDKRKNDYDYVQLQDVKPKAASEIFNGAATPITSGGVITGVLNDFTKDNENYIPVANYFDGHPMTDVFVDNVIYRKINSQYYRLSNEYITLKRFGAKGDGITDDWASIQKAITTCSRMGLVIHATEGQYNFSKTLDFTPTYAGYGQTLGNPFYDNGGNPFFAVKMLGAGISSTILKYTGNDTAMTFLGGSGSSSGGGLEDIGFQGNGANNFMYLQGRCGMYFIKCSFSNLKTAFILHNAHPGQFTEGTTIKNCVFNQNVHLKIKFQTGDGVTTGGGYIVTHNDTWGFPDGQLVDYSFNNTTLDDCLSNLDASDSCDILITTGCCPYNSKIGWECWSHGNKQAVIQNNGLGSSNFQGYIKTENFGGSTVRDSLLCYVKGVRLPILGAYQIWGGARAGSAVFSKGVGGILGNLDVEPTPYTYKGIIKNGYLETDVSVSGQLGDAQMAVITVVGGSSYRSQFLVTLHGFFYSPDGNVTIEDMQEFTRSAGNPYQNYRWPTFRIANSKLIIEGKDDGGNAWTSPLDVTINVIPIIKSFNESR